MKNIAPSLGLPDHWMHHQVIPDDEVLLFSLTFITAELVQNESGKPGPAHRMVYETDV